MASSSHEPSSPTLLEELLALKTAEGELLGSSSFTLDSLRALRKLSEFQLGQPGLWLVKMVQAAVAAGAPEVRITLGRAEVSVSFRHEQEWEAERLLQLVLSGELPADRALGHLVAGMRGSLDTRSEQAWWSCGQSQVELRAGQVKVDSTPGSDLFTFRTRRRARLPSFRELAGNLEKLVRLTVDELLALSSRCFVCPIPIFIDGRPLLRGYQAVETPETLPPLRDGSFRREHLKSICACLGWIPLGSAPGRPPLPQLPLSSEESDPVLKKPLYRGETFLQSSWPEKSPVGVVTVLAHQPLRSRVDLVLDGAVVESRPLNRWMVHSRFGTRRLLHHPLAVRFTYALRPDEVDLSQFRAADIDVDSLVEKALPTLQELLERIERNLDKFVYLWFPRDYRAVALTMLAAPAVIGGLALGPLGLLPMGAAMSGGVAANAHTARQKVREAVLSLLFLLPADATSATA